MTFSSARKWIIGGIAALSIAGVGTYAKLEYGISLPSNQLVTFAQIASGISDGTYVVANSCSSSSVVVAESDVNNCVQTIPNCLTNPQQLPTFAQINACLATPTPAPTSTPTSGPSPTATPTATPTSAGSTNIVAVTDPWLINGSTYWPTLNGSPVFVAESAVGGSPSNAQAIEGTTTIYQNFNGGGTITAGTAVAVSAYMTNGSNTITYSDASCQTNTVTATGTATLEILNSANAVVASVSATTGSFAGYQLYYTVPTTGVYREAFKVAIGTKTYQIGNSSVHAGPGQQTCVAGSTLTDTAYGQATRATAAN